MAPERDARRVAVIGSGIAGLSCAYLLAEEGFQVSLLEKYTDVGMDAHCVNVEATDGSMLKLNTPPRSFSKAYYPCLMELYERSGVEIEPWSWAWVAFAVGQYSPFIRVDRDVRLFGYALPSYVDLSRPFESLRIMLDGYRWSRAVGRDLANPKLACLKLRDYIAHLGLSEVYMFKALLPTLSMVCTCSYEACLDYPAGLVMEFYAKTTTYGQYRTRFGTQDAVSHLTKRVERVKTGVSVERVVLADEGQGGPAVPQVEYVEAGARKVESFDLVVLATQANHAAKVLSGAPAGLVDLLHVFKHETSEVAIHRDESVMPGDRSKWAPMSIGVLPDRDTSRGGSMFTIWMNDSFPRIKGNLFQTWNPVVDIDNAKLVDDRIVFERPIMTLESLEAVTSLAKAQGTGGVWYCGAWNARRIPLQESGVMSAVEVVRRIVGRRSLKGGTFDDVDASSATFSLSRLDSGELYETRVSGLLSPSGLLGCAVVASALVVLSRINRLT